MNLLMQTSPRLYLNLIFAAALATLVVVFVRLPDDFVARAALGAVFTLLSVGLVLINRALIHARALATIALRLQTLVENSDDVIAIASVDRKLEFMNRAGRELLGYGEGYVGTSTTDLYPPESNEIIVREVLPLVRARHTWRGEFTYRNVKTLDRVPVRATTFALRDPDSDQVMGFATVSKNLVEEKRLRRDLDRFFEVSLDMLAIANLKGYFTRLNPAFEKVLGWTEAELCARPCTDFIHPDDIKATLDTLADQARGSAVASFENRYRTKSGEYRWLSWKSRVEGELTYGAARDVTAEKLRTEQTEHLGQRAIAASLAKSEFLANMSHEIRTPINGVIGSTALLFDSGLTQEQLNLAEDINASANSLLTVINDILDFSKIEAGKLDVEILDFDLKSVVEESMQNVSWLLRHKSLPLTATGLGALSSHYRGDPGRVRQVLMNLLSNAVKFTTTGSITVDVQTLSANDAGALLRVSVTDTGIGISETALPRLFQAFTQADQSTSRRFGGSGLGLSISRRLVELMGGEMGVDSREGRGSTFWFTLKLAKSDKVGVAVNRTRQPIPRTDFEDASILVAEDNPINQKIMLAMLRKMGFRAQAVANGLEVLAILRDVPFDLILMDCQMPEMDGYEATRRIRAAEQSPHRNIPIIAMTANALKGDRERCLECGMNDYASKPIGAEDLANVIERWL